MTDRVGQHLGNYRLTRLLGEGSFAVVYLGEHTLLGTTIAIKVLHTQIAQGEVAKFQQEARLLASLKHPHIVRVLDFGIQEQIPYLVMDYAPNGTLRTRHRRGTTLPVMTVVDYVKQVAQVLQYAHDRKIIHRNIKPENMLLDEHGNILLSDFGVALIAQSSHYQNTKKMAGTIGYCAPEQIQGQPCAASDQYALGIVVYEWLCGNRPFHGSFSELANQHLTAPPPSLREKLARLSPDIEHVVFTALAKQPEDRYPAIQAFAQALELASQDLLPTELLHPIAPSSPHPSPVPLAKTSSTTPDPLPVLASPLNQPVSTTTDTTPTHLSACVCAPTCDLNPVDLTLPEKLTNMSRISRRIVLIGAAGILTMAGVGTGIFIMTHQPKPIPQGQLFFTYRGHPSNVESAAWSPPDGKRIASGSWDYTVQVWNVNNGGHLFTYKPPQYVRSVAWSPDGKWIAFGSGDKTVQVWNTNDGSLTLTYRGHSDAVWSITWSPDGKRIASGSSDKTVQVWNASNGSHLFTYNGHSNYVNTVAWSPDGQRIASGSDDMTVQVWNASDGSHLFTYNGHSDYVWSVAWSPDGQHIASGSRDNTAQIWNASNGGHVFTYYGHSSYVGAVTWSPDGQRIASGSSDKTVQVWNLSH
jgi:WD40 repeat protein